MKTINALVTMVTMIIKILIGNNLVTILVTKSNNQNLSR